MLCVSQIHSVYVCVCVLLDMCMCVCVFPQCVCTLMMHVFKSILCAFTAVVDQYVLP